MAGQPMELLTGGAGMYSTQPPVSAQNANGGKIAALAGLPQPHYGPVAIVLLAVVVLFVLDRAGFRFAVTAGRR